MNVNQIVGKTIKDIQNRLDYIYIIFTDGNCITISLTYNGHEINKLNYK